MLLDVPHSTDHVKVSCLSWEYDFFGIQLLAHLMPNVFLSIFMGIEVVQLMVERLRRMEKNTVA